MFDMTTLWETLCFLLIRSCSFEDMSFCLYKQFPYGAASFLIVIVLLFLACLLSLWLYFLPVQAEECTTKRDVTSLCYPNTVFSLSQMWLTFQPGSITTITN